MPYADPEKRKEFARQYRNSPKAKAARAEYIRRPEFREAARARAKKRYQDPAVRKRHKESQRKYYLNNQTIETRYKRYVNDAKLRGLEFNLTVEMFKELVSSHCYYCGETEGLIGIDRRDNNIGYLPENCLSCCKVCNYAKRMRTLDEFISHCERVALKQNLIHLRKI